MHLKLSSTRNYVYIWLIPQLFLWWPHSLLFLMNRFWPATCKCSFLVFMWVYLVLFSLAFEPWSVGLVPFPTIILVCGVLKAYVNQCGGPLVLFLFLLNGRKLLNKGQGAIISSLLFLFFIFVLFYCLFSLEWLYIFRIFFFLYL